MMSRWGQALGGASGDVVAGALVVAHPDDHAVVQSAVGSRSPPRLSRCRLILPTRRSASADLMRPRFTARVAVG